MPNWVIHGKWTDKAKIDRLIANYVNQNIDYGTEWAFSKDARSNSDEEESNASRQLKFFYKKDLEKQYSNEKMYVKAFYIHHLLNFLKETRLNVRDLDIVFAKFLKKKVQSDIIDENGESISFMKEINEIFVLVKDNQDELIEDLL
ncbi:MAG: hypothetical protein MUP85_19585 [Candidatus Lokiarchaeota archaeon]|nr:hypothetical protein [Candidatus Lokiarchaeota archaeon]